MAFHQDILTEFIPLLETLFDCQFSGHRTPQLTWGWLYPNTNTLAAQIKDLLESASLYGVGLIHPQTPLVKISASEFIEVSGKDKNTDSNNPESTIRAGVQTGPSRSIIPTGNARNLTINTPSLAVNNQAKISVENQGTGDAGNIDVFAESINLNKAGGITASTLSGNGGNITFKTDQLQTKNNSNISTSAGGQGDGGNIDITTDSLLAINNSDITAKAEKGNGGNINITAAAILGIQERETTDTTSDIDASSEFGQDGIVTVNDPNVLIQDPIISLAKINRANNEEQKVSKCWDSEYNRHDFKVVYTGRSGFAANPNNFSDDEEIIATPGYVPPDAEQEKEQDWDLFIWKDWKEGDPYVNANAVRVDENGDIYFVAELTPQSAQSLLCKPKKES